MDFQYLLGLNESGDLVCKVHTEFELQMLIIDTEQWVSYFMMVLHVSEISKPLQYWVWEEGNSLPLRSKINRAAILYQMLIKPNTSSVLWDQMMY